MKKQIEKQLINDQIICNRSEIKDINSKLSLYEFLKDCFSIEDAITSIYELNISRLKSRKQEIELKLRLLEGQY